MNKLPKSLIITGQTATGKTELAMILAEKMNGALINADARQIYQKLDVITGKDVLNNKYLEIKKFKKDFSLGFYTKNKTPIWLYDILDIKKTFSVHDWLNCVEEVLKEFKKKQSLPIFVGGTYFYLKGLWQGIMQKGVSGNWSFRNEIERKSVEELQQILKEQNQKQFLSLNHSDSLNPRRLIRWIEKEKFESERTEDFYVTKLPLINSLNLKTECSIIGLRFKDKQALRLKIRNRIEERLKQGAVEEVELLLKLGFCGTDPGLQTIGYQQLIAYLENRISLTEAVNIWLNKECQYAKRQLTFMKTNPNILWYNIDEFSVDEISSRILKGIKEK